MMEQKILFEEWQSQKEYNQNDLYEYAVNDDEIRISLKGKNYVSLQFNSVTYDILPEHNYRINFNLDVKGENAWAKVVYGWYNSEKQAIIKGYVSEGDVILSPKGASYLKISLNVHSYKPAEFKMSSLSAYSNGKYSLRNVRLSTIALKYPIYPAKKDCEDNLKETLEKIDELCSKEHPDLVVLTETFYTRKCRMPVKIASLPENSRPIHLIREKAKKYNTYIVFSFNENENDVYYNTGFLIDRNGEIAGKYHKSHLTMAEYECGMAPGEEIKVFDTDIGKIGIAICWDIFFPEVVRKMQKLGVDIICNPTAGYRESRIIERARESGAYIITSTVSDFSDSAVFNPDGEKLCTAADNNGYGVTTVDINKPYYEYWLSYDAETCAKNIFLNEARWELY